jgi:hypothetical protein
VSLINDALNRARAEAARREAEDRGETSMPLTGQKRSFRLSPAIWPVGGVILLALLVWLWRGEGPQPTEVGKATSAVTEPASGESPSREPLTTGASDAEPGRGDSEASRTPLEKTSSTESRNTGSPRQESPAPISSSAAVAAPSPSPAGGDAVVTETAEAAPASTQSYPESFSRQELVPPAVVETPDAIASSAPETGVPASSAVEGPTSESSPSTTSPAAVWPADGDSDETWYYVGSVALPGGGSIELGGIAWSAAAPSAMLNGSLLGVGDEILGLTVGEIGPRTVVLEGRGQRIALQLGSAQP